MKEIAKEALRKTVLFGNLSEPHLALLVSLTSLKEFSRGEVIFRQGDIGDTFYIIISGRIRISRQIPGMGEEALAILNPGDYFGEMALLEEEERSADALVHEKAVLLSLTKRDLEDLLFVNKDVAYEVLWAFVRTLSSRLRETSNKLTFLTVSSKFG
jgi:CRP/FNR family transcriptional regulator, cyclic AMP receptor protein